MRLGKRERARLRLERAQALAYRHARDKIIVIAPASPDIHMSMYGRLKPVLRPVGKPSMPTKAHTCPSGKAVLPDGCVRPLPSRRKSLAPRWSNPRLV